MYRAAWPIASASNSSYREKRSSLSPKPCRSIQALLAKNESLHITSALTPTLRGFLTHLSDSVRLVGLFQNGKWDGWHNALAFRRAAIWFRHLLHPLNLSRLAP